MDVTVALSSSSRTTAGVILFTVLAVEWGGLTVLSLVRGKRPATDFQRAFARAGHAHAGVFVIFALVSQVLVDATELESVWEYLARYGAAAAAVLFPAGFFLSSIARDAVAPNRLIVLVYLGAVALAAGSVSLGVGLLTAGGPA
jgi:drug/metabolite transporter superfamily protein YnfA